MKLNMKALARYAKAKALRNDTELSQELGIGQCLIRSAREGQRIGYDAVKNFYNCNGEAMTVKFINFEEETLNGFQAKYIRIGNKLY